MVKIPKTLWTHINTALPNDVCLVATVLQSGYAQITLRGSTLVFDDGHFSLWGTGQGLDDGKSRRRHKGHDLLPQAAASHRRYSAERWNRTLLWRRPAVQVGSDLRG